MKILVFSDIHGNALVLKKLQKAIDYIKPDKIYFLGDVFGYFYEYEKCITFLKKNNAICLMGNHDFYVSQLLNGDFSNHKNLIIKYGSGYKKIFEKKEIYLDYLKKLELVEVLTVEKKKIGFIHGSLPNYLEGRVYPDTEINNLFFNDFDIVFCGHTHHRIIKIYDNKILVNVGSVGQPRDGQKPCFLIYDTVQNSIKFNDIHINFNKLILTVIENNDDNKKYFNKIIKKLPY